MRAAVFSCLMAAFSLTLAACATSPRDPARVEYRNASGYANGPSSTSIARAPARSCRDGYTVRNGDTLSEIAERCGVEMRALAQANGLRSPYTLRVNQSLTMPRPPVHVVQRGENLYRIGLRYDIPFQQLAAHNGIGAPYAIEVGQQIQLPAGTVASYSGSTSRETASTSTRSNPAPTNRTSTPAAGAPSFDWPIRGNVLSGFGRKPDGGRNDGINIAARSGASVRASAAGQVVYAGNELAGYGELILIRHNNNFVTAYAHNSRLLVREGDQIERGQVIAEAGSTGTVDEPQVHFEIRRGVNPEDPMAYLR